jgi:hypothetical protein
MRSERRPLLQPRLLLTAFAATARVALALGIGALAAAPAWAQGFGPPHVEQPKVQLAALAGWGFGGSVQNVTLEQAYSFQAAPVFGGALDIKLSAGWNVELYYSRQQSELGAGLGPAIDVTLERYLAGIQEEKGSERFRWFGTFYVGATRFVPGISGFDSDTRFTGGIGLGAKAFFSKNVGLRFEARGFYTVVDAEGGFICGGGTCLFSFSGSGLWQGDVGGGLILAF